MISMKREAHFQLPHFFPNFGIIQTRFYFETFKIIYGDIFHIGSEDLNQDIISIALPKKSTLLNPFNMV